MSKVIKVYDNVIERQYREDFYHIFSKRQFNIGWGDSVAIEDRDKQFWYSEIWIEEFQKLGFLDKITDKDLLGKIDNRTPNQIVVNCTTYSDVYLPHTHYDTDVLLYYINLDWKQEWWGESLFYSDDLKDIIYTGQYVPGRITWFDGGIPHTIKPQSHIAPKFRFSISIFFKRTNKSGLENMEWADKDYLIGKRAWIK